MRTEPSFVKPDEKVNFKGAFRRMVLGSAYDSITESIVTCLHNPLHHKPEDEKIASICAHYCKQTATGTTTSLCESDFKDAAKKPCPLFSAMDAHGEESSGVFTACIKAHLGDKRIMLARKEDSNRPFPRNYVLALVLNDLAANRAFLKSHGNRIIADLREIGLPVKQWFVEYKGHTYNEKGEFESAFEQELLDAVELKMTELSGRSFARPAPFGYQVLADALRESNVELVKGAVLELKRQDSLGLRRREQRTEIRTMPTSWEMVPIQS